MDLIDNTYKVSHSHEEFEVKDGQIVSKGQVDDGKHLPTGDEGMEKLIMAISQAVAEKVIAHIQQNLQLTGGAATFAGQSAFGQWDGVGGGVPGPVKIFSGAGIAGSETLNIAPGTFK